LVLIDLLGCGLVRQGRDCRFKFMMESRIVCDARLEFRDDLFFSIREHESGLDLGCGFGLGRGLSRGFGFGLGDGRVGFRTIADQHRRHQDDSGKNKKADGMDHVFVLL
jgi:hypothetical protein